MRQERLWDGLILAGAVGFTAWLLPWPLILAQTFPTGGDTPSQYSALVHFVEHILPRFRLWGWNPGSLAGYPQGQFYFPLPFLGMALLNLGFDLTVAFKLGVLLPALTLPLSVYFCLKRLDLDFPGPAMGGVLSLVFLLSETNKVWGGNLASILAGEFCYAWAFNLVLIYLGLLPTWIRQGRGLVPASILLFLVGLSHAYGLLFALVAGLFFLFYGNSLKRAALRLLALYTVAFFLLGMWTIPMLVYSPYTEMFNFVWVIDSWKDFLPPTLWPVFVLAVLGAALSWKPGTADDRARACYLAFWAASAATLYLAAPLMNAVTIRFGPFGHLALVLLGAQGLTLLTRRLRARGLAALVVLLAGVTWAGARVTYLDHWLNWNNAGVQRQALWPSLERLTAYLQGDQSWPRVHYEHSPLNGRAGSVRAFESLPLLCGRSTLEGVYLQASANAPYIFYLQSETSQRGSSPLPGYVYSRFNLERALVHLRLFNVSHYIAVDPKTKAAARSQPEFFLEREFPPFALFRVVGGNGSYAQVPRYKPVLVVTDRPQALAFQWYRFTDCRVPLVLVRDIPPGMEGGFSAVFLDSGRDDDPLLSLIRGDKLPRVGLGRVDIQEKIGNERIELRGLARGRPVLIKVSYHPAWRSEGGERVFRAGPAFMLVFPRSERLVLTFGPAWPHKAGLVLTGLGVLAVLVLLFKRNLQQPPWMHTEFPLHKRKRIWIKILAVLIWGLGLAWLSLDHGDATTLRNKARDLAEKGRVVQARAFFEKGLERFPMSLVVDYTLYDLAMTYFREGDCRGAEKYFIRIIREFPDSAVLPETLYHYGLCLKNRSQKDRAFDYWQRLILDFPETHWAGLARQGQ